MKLILSAYSAGIKSLGWFSVLSACLTALLLSLSLPAQEAVKPAVGLVVVAPNQLHEALKPFIEWKSRSRPTTLVSLEAIRESEKGVDDAEKVKRRLYGMWKNEKIGFALLVGDADVFPVRYMVLDRVTAPAFDYAFYPSDLYFADLADSAGEFDDWNRASEGFHARYFGEVRGEKNKNDPINYDGIDYLPEIAVGRWPVSTPEEVRRMATKSIRYETTLPGREKQAAYLVVSGWVDSRPLFTQFSETLKDWKPRRLFYGKDADSAPNVDNALSVFRDGVQLIFHSGHGEPTGWDRSLGVNHLDRIANAGRLPIILSAGCSTAYLATLPPYEPYVDAEGKEHAGTNAGQMFKEPPPPPAVYQRGKYNGTSMGEQLLRRSENGAVAYFGCNTGSQPCGLTLLAGFAESIGASRTATLGEAWQDAIRHYWKKERLADLKPTSSWYPASIFFQGMKFMLFGDPTLPLR